MSMLPLPPHVAADPGRLDPEARLASIESEIRLRGAFAHLYTDEDFGSTGVGMYAHPAATRPEAAWRYVWLARDFEAQGDDGAAAHAFWGALVITNTTFASKPDRSRIRRAAYEGLRSSASRRGQWDRAALFELCVVMYDTYLASSTARAADSAFAGVMRAMHAMEATADGALGTSRRAGIASAGMELLGIFADPNNTANNYASAARSNQLVAEQNALVTVLNSTRDKRLQSLDEFVHRTKREMSTVTPSGMFASQEVADLIQGMSVAELAPYLKSLSHVAARWPRVAQALQVHGVAPTSESLSALETNIAAVEAIAFWSILPRENR
jgi:hypothetical protein